MTVRKCYVRALADVQRARIRLADDRMITHRLHAVLLALGDHDGIVTHVTFSLFVRRSRVSCLAERIRMRWDSILWAQTSRERFSSSQYERWFNIGHVTCTHAWCIVLLRLYCGLQNNRSRDLSKDFQMVSK